ncbi:hypothetical protein CLOP_g18818 [Closterium sp. NIES-67]|nr:hypothetical protein CLOP_g18818 [Closterium sp. NIES-67]
MTKPHRDFVMSQTEIWLFKSSTQPLRPSQPHSIPPNLRLPNNTQRNLLPLPLYSTPAGFNAVHSYDEIRVQVNWRANFSHFFFQASATS